MKIERSVEQEHIPDLCWEELLDELFHFVLSKLRGTNVGRVRRVCSSWKYKAHRLLDKISFQIGRELPVVRLTALFPALVQLRLDFMGQDRELGQLASLSGLSRLTSLDLNNQEEPGVAPVVDLGSLKSVKGLESLTLRRCKFSSSSGLQEITQLRYLQFSKCLMDVLEPSLGKILKAMKRLKHLQIENCLPRSRACLKGLRGLVNLEHAVIHLPLANFDEVSHELGSLPLLTSLDIGLIPCPSLVSISDTGLGCIACLTQLKCLRLGGHYGVTDSGIRQLSSLQNLTELDLSVPGPLIELLYNELDMQRSILTNAGLWHLVELRNLASLTISYTRVTNDFVRQVLPYMCRLEHLNVSHCMNISDTACFGFGGCNQITSLDISYCHISDMGLLGLSKSAPNLKKLNLAGSKRTISDQGLMQLCKLPRLCWLSLACCEDITDLGVQELVSHTSRLEYLSLRGCAQLTDLGIAAVGRRLSYLRELALGCSCKITDSAADSIKNIPGLEVVNLPHEMFSIETCKMLCDNGIDILISKPWWM